MENHRVFCFENFDVDLSRGTVSFQYSIDGKLLFQPVLTVDLSSVESAIDIESAVFALGMAELPHFWKAILAPEIVIKAGKMNADQVAFWKNLYEKGLGEFFYTNKVDFRKLINITIDSQAPGIKSVRVQEGEETKVLVSFGGGKDSIVVGEILKEKGINFTWFTLEAVPFSKSIFEVSGNIKHINIGRDVPEYFKEVIKLVDNGAPNGHVPITATYIFSAALVATINGFSDVLFSTERSADESNVTYLGHDINHQYSKTFEFEKAAHSYIKDYVSPQINLFSLLRNKYEIQIIEMFSKHPKYFDIFLSCNRGLKNKKWCCKCPKCAFIFAGLSAFLNPPIVERIFGKNLFEDESLLPLYKTLIGESGHKPFDCVGTVSENLLAIYLAKKQYTGKLPVVLEGLDVSSGAKYKDILTAETDQHLIPSLFLKT